MKLKKLVYVLPTVMVALILVLWAFWLEPASLRAQVHQLKIDTWPLACGDLRIAVLSDLHVGSPYNGVDKLQEIVDLTNAQGPDLILMPGDFVIQGVKGGSFVTPEAMANVLGNLSAPLGTYAVLGNHDWWLDSKSIIQAFENVGIPVLENRSLALKASKCDLHVVGFGDLWEGQPDINKALAEIPAEAITIAFTHNPDLFPQVPVSVALTVAGHTHGGQVKLPFVGSLVVPSAFGQRFVEGHVVEKGRHLFVSSGLGTSILPVRFFVPPEISIVELSSAAGE